MILALFGRIQECAHEKIAPSMDFGYCPDCGEYVENHWFITRCACCGIKQKTKIVKDKVSADVKYCRNCGNNSFVAEKLTKINFVDIQYAALIKQVIKNKRQDFIQSWVDPVDPNPKLLPLFKKL